MILTRPELALVVPALALLADESPINIDIHITNPAHRRDVRIGVCAAGVTIKCVPTDTAPSVEHYRSVMGLAMAYKVPLGTITNQNEGD